VTLYQTLGAFERAYSVIRRLQDARVEGQGQGFIGSLPAVAWGSMLLDEERYEEALEKFQELEEVSQDHDNAARILPAAEAELRSVEAHFALGQDEVAYRILDQFEMPGDTGRQRDQIAGLFKYGQALGAFENHDYEDAAALAREARASMRSAGHDRDARRAALLIGQAMSEEGRSTEARSLLERELQELQEQSNHVPESLRPGFFTVPVHQKLVAVVRELNGDIPSEFAAVAARARAAEQAESAKASEVDVDSESFRRWRARYPEIVGEDERIHQIFRVIDRVADSESPVLLQGESGTGKELIAEAVHRHSPREDGPLVKVNCAAFVEDLLLSELFGHVKGAFTGAVTDKMGRFEMADGGTLFLDEIGDISPKTQVALLRVLQENTFEKVGGTETKKVDVRVVCATNKNLDDMVQRGDFRLDLYYRLKGVVIEVPPLRERRQDIPRLVTHFAKKYAGAETPKRFSRPVLKFLASYSWPGNIRELQNFVRSILLFVEGESVEMSHVREFSEFFAGGEVDMDLPEIDYDVTVEEYEDVGDVFEDPEEALVEQIIAEGLSLSNLKKRLELESIKRALVETGGNITRAAEILQMKRPRLSQIVNSTDELLSLKEELVG
ncbi:MAG: sigma 54-interacting transcriptional regulator, partial [Myxococcota bacterium]